MLRSHSILPAVKHQRFPCAVAVVFDLSKEYQMVTALILSDIAADQRGNHAIEQRHPGLSGLEGHTRKLVWRRSCKTSGNIVLICAEDVDRKMLARQVVRQTRRTAGNTPKHQWRIE
ncbi:hypothetical protein D3C87_1646370 [compost metagenome]